MNQRDRERLLRLADKYESPYGEAEGQALVAFVDELVARPRPVPLSIRRGLQFVHRLAYADLEGVADAEYPRGKVAQARRALAWLGTIAFHGHK